MLKEDAARLCSRNLVAAAIGRDIVGAEPEERSAFSAARLTSSVLATLFVKEVR